MTDLQCYKQAIKDYEELAEMVNGKDYKEIVEELKNKGQDIWYVDDELSDINYGTCCLTIRNECGKAKVLEGSIEVYNDSEDSCLGDYTLEELKRLLMDNYLKDLKALKYFYGQMEMRAEDETDKIKYRGCIIALNKAIKLYEGEELVALLNDK